MAAAPLKATLAEEEGKAVIRTPKGAGMLVEKIIGTNFEKIVLVCKRAGGPMRRHDTLRDALALWLRELGHRALTEQMVPDWHDTEENTAARLDVVYHSGATTAFAWTSA